MKGRSHGKNNRQGGTYQPQQDSEVTLGLNGDVPNDTQPLRLKIERVYDSLATGFRCGETCGGPPGERCRTSPHVHLRPEMVSLVTLYERVIKPKDINNKYVSEDYVERVGHSW